MNSSHVSDVESDAQSTRGESAALVTSPPALPARSRGFDGIGRRIASRTTDLLAIAIVLIGGLTMGRQVLEWWSVDDMPVGSDGQSTDSMILNSSIWESDATPVTMEFGNLPFRMERQSLTGDRESVLRAMVAYCRTVLPRASVPVDPMSPEERRLLERLNTATATEEEPAQWHVYCLDGPALTVVGTRNVRTDPSAERRVACWMLGLPGAECDWTMMTLWPTGVNSQLADDGRADGLPVFELPQASQQVLSLEAVQGGRVIAFQGTGTLADWLREIDRQSTSKQWIARSHWHPFEQGLQRWFEVKDHKASIVVQIEQRSSNRLEGIVSVLSQ